MSFLQIAIPSPLRRLFDYLPPKNLSIKLSPGMRVRVPFANKQVVGLLVRVSEESCCPTNKLKRAIEVLDNTSLLTTNLFNLICWTADYYHYPIGEALQQALPRLLRQGKTTQVEQEIFWTLTTEGQQIDQQKFTRAPKQWQTLQQLRELRKVHESTFGFSTRELKSLGFDQTILKVLKHKNLLIQFQTDKTEKQSYPILPSPILNSDQQIAVDTVLNQQNIFQTFLLQGITGSGKTEVYLTILKQMISKHEQALILVPEIGLTPQIVKRFQERLDCQIAVLHSALTDKERLNVWLQAKRGQINIVIGTRSAIFTPFKNLSIIIVDESHDISFKQWDRFKYHARDVAIRRAQMENIPIILGSATPSLVSIYNEQCHRFTLLSLPNRAGNAKLPTFALLDMRKQTLEEGITQSALNDVERCLNRGEQVLIFLNRRGFAPVLMCHECGWVAECIRCQSSYTVHQQKNYLCCHHCGKQKSIPKYCRECNGEQLFNLGIGTERIEHFLQNKFPDKKIARIDRDTTKIKGSLENKLSEINKGNAQILIGTQMLAKGHHFPNVTLVVILDIDNSLYSTDFNANEHMAQLLLQVAGRAGREQKPGHALIQTHHPEHPLLQTLINQSYNAFAQVALQERKMAQLPPYQYFALIRVEAVKNDAIGVFLQQMKKLFEQQNTSVMISNPVPAPIEKRAGRYRWQLLLSANKRSNLHALLKTSLPEVETLKSARKVRWSVDIDPIDML